jgi:hypothetical protein
VGIDANARRRVNSHSRTYGTSLVGPLYAARKEGKKAFVINYL